MIIKIIDDKNFPNLETATSYVQALLQEIGTRDLIALYVMAEASEHALFELLSEEVYLISGHEEEDDGVEIA